jgi:hypothetical protein
LVISDASIFASESIQVTQGEQVTLTLKLVNLDETALNDIEAEFVAPPAWIEPAGEHVSVNVPAKSEKLSRPTARLPFTFTVSKNAPLEPSAPLELKVFSSAKGKGPSWTKEIQLAVAPRPVPKSFALLQNYPNPFNPETWIPYQLPKSAEVTISIYDVSGKLVRHLDVGFQEAGFYMDRESATYWDGRNNNGESVASGLYFYYLHASESYAIRRLLILK